MMRKAFSSRSLSLIRSQSRSFSSSIYNRSAAPPANGEEETLEQRVRREISEEQDVDYFTNFGKKYPIVSHEIEIEQLEKEHKKLDQELTFWPYIHAVVVAVLLVS